MNPTLVVIPTYNERENLDVIVKRTLAASAEVDVLVVDDNSPDGTGKLADFMASNEPRIHVLHRVKKEGLGRAYLQGFDWALSRGYQKVFEMDADGSHPPEKLAEMVALLNSFDMVVGSRWVEGGKVENWPWYREALSRGGNAYARWALGLAVQDATGGYRGFTRATLEAIDLRGIDAKGYVFQIDTLNRVIHADLSVVEVPITFTDRVHGRSKMSPSVALESLLAVTRQGVAARRALSKRSA